MRSQCTRVCSTGLPPVRWAEFRNVSRMKLNPCMRAAVLAAVCLITLPALALEPGTYRCSSYNVSGGGGSCRNFQPLILAPDGTYRFSSARGQWSVRSGRLLLSASTLWGPGEVLDDGSVRFEYDYRGWHHTITWVCQDCRARAEPPAAALANAPAADRIGVTLTLRFDEAIGGVTGFVIVPAEAAQDYGHNAPLPSGAVQGLAWETGETTVQMATGRDNTLPSGRRYVVFLVWPRETLPVAVLDLPAGNEDFTGTLAASLGR